MKILLFFPICTILLFGNICLVGSDSDMCNKIKENNVSIISDDSENHNPPIIINLQLEKEKKEMNFNYFTENTEYMNSKEFTWWGLLPDNIKDAKREYELIFQDKMPDFKIKEKRIAISMGRKIKFLYYFEASEYGTEDKTCFCHPVFEETYFPNTVFFYTFSSNDKIGFHDDIARLDIRTYDMREFNRNGNIPYEIIPYEEIPIFTDLKYVCDCENADLSWYRNMIDLDDTQEFTWWDGDYDYLDIKRFFLETFKVSIPSFDTKDKFIITTYNRKLKDLYYYDESKYTTYHGGRIGRPIFEEGYYPNTIFIYTISLSYPITFDHLLSTNDMNEFNKNGNIPYDIQPYNPEDGYASDMPEEMFPYQW